MNSNIAPHVIYELEMPKAPTIDDISEDFKIRPRDRERLLKILESQDEDPS